METKQIQPKKMIVARTRTSHNKIMQDSDPLIQSMMAEIEKNGIAPAGPMEFIYYGATDDMNHEYTLEIALPLAQNADTTNTTFEIKDSQEFKCISHIHKGSLENIAGVYDELYQEIGKQDIHPTDQIREVYQNWVDFSSEENITEIQVGIN